MLLTERCYLFLLGLLLSTDVESCVENQTLRDKSCLVPCTGLYADIADDSLEQTTQVLIEGNCDLLSLTFF